MNKIKILAMDDSPTVQKLLKMVLEEEGYEVISASDGIEGIDKAKKTHPSIILIDFVMPKMNGFQVCKIIKEDPELKNIPIILVTSKGDEVGGKFVKMLGVTEYLTKPFQPNDLISKISEVIDKNSHLRELVAQGQEFANESSLESRMDESLSINEIVEPLSTDHPARPRIISRDNEPENIVELMVREVMDDIFYYINEALPDILREKILKLKSGEGKDDSNNKDILLSGDLALFRFPDILQLLGIQRLTGCLTVTSDENNVNIFLRDGRITFLSYWDDWNEALGDILVNIGKLSRVQLQHFIKEKGSLKDILIDKKLSTLDEIRDLVSKFTEESIYNLFSLVKGNFQFKNEVVPKDMEDISAQLNVNDIILEGVRRIDEWQLINKKICNRNAVLKKLIANAEELGEVTLSDKELEILSLVDGKRKVNQIIKESRMSEFEVCKILYVLLTANLLTMPDIPSKSVDKQRQYL